MPSTARAKFERPSTSSGRGSRPLRGASGRGREQAIGFNYSPERAEPGLTLEKCKARLPALRSGAIPSSAERGRLCGAGAALLQVGRRAPCGGAGSLVSLLTIAGLEINHILLRNYT